MHYRGNIILFLLMPVVSACFAQDVSHQVIVPWATIADVSDYNINQTVGESIVEVLDGNDYFLTQGFHQPRIHLTGQSQIDDKWIEVYPNPVIDFLNIEFSRYESTDFEVIIFGLNGTLYYQQEISCGRYSWKTEAINLSKYKRGMYFLRIRSLDNRVSRLFKIEKM